MEQIRILLNSELKEKFKKACDGRPMSIVIKLLILEYIKRKEIPENDKNR